MTTQRPLLSKTHEKELYICLAELLFLDTEPQDYEYSHAAKLIQQYGISKAEVLEILITEIAPIAGANLGYLIYPVIGEWAGFDDSIYDSIVSYRQKRKTKLNIIIRLQDTHAKWMLKHLDVEKLLTKL